MQRTASLGLTVADAHAFNRNDVEHYAAQGLSATFVRVQSRDGAWATAVALTKAGPATLPDDRDNSDNTDSELMSEPPTEPPMEPPTEPPCGAPTEPPTEPSMEPTPYALLGINLEPLSSKRISF